MTTIQRVLITDDLDGSDAAGTVRFALDGQGYEIDLSPVNDTALRAALGRYITAARRQQVRAGRGRSAGRGGRGTPDPIEALAAEHRAQVRAWAKANPEALAGLGLPAVSDRGRLSLAVVRAYDAVRKGGQS